MHLVTQISINSIQPIAIGPPEEGQTDTIPDHRSVSQQCVPGGIFAKGLEWRRQRGRPVLRQSTSLALVIGHTDREYGDADEVGRHACCERGAHQRCDSPADLTAQPPLHPYTPQGGDRWLPGSREPSSVTGQTLEAAGR